MVDTDQVYVIVDDQSQAEIYCNTNSPTTDQETCIDTDCTYEALPEVRTKLNIYDPPQVPIGKSRPVQCTCQQQQNSTRNDKDKQETERILTERFEHESKKTKMYFIVIGLITAVLLVVSLIAFILAAFAAGQNAQRISQIYLEIKDQLNSCTQLTDELSREQQMLYDKVNTSFVLLNNLQNQASMTQSNVTAVRHQFISLQDQLGTNVTTLHDKINTSFVLLNNLQNQVKMTQSNVTAVRHQSISLQDQLSTTRLSIEAQMNRTLADEPRKL